MEMVMKQNLRKLTLCVLLTLLIAGCKQTPAPVFDTGELMSTGESITRINNNCAQQIQKQGLALETATPSQYLSLANTAEFCVSDVTFFPEHPDLKAGMQFKALAVVNFIKAGDMENARRAFHEFREWFPQQDLLFEDYSSFVDTSSVLLFQDEMDRKKLAKLNINNDLRAQLKRQQQWQMN